MSVLIQYWTARYTTPHLDRVLGLSTRENPARRRHNSMAMAQGPLLVRREREVELGLRHSLGISWERRDGRWEPR